MARRTQPLIELFHRILLLRKRKEGGSEGAPYWSLPAYSQATGQI